MAVVPALLVVAPLLGCRTQVEAGLGLVLFSLTKRIFYFETLWRIGLVTTISVDCNGIVILEGFLLRLEARFWAIGLVTFNNYLHQGLFWAQNDCNDCNLAFFERGINCNDFFGVCDASVTFRHLYSLICFVYISRIMRLFPVCFQTSAVFLAFIVVNNH